MMERLLPWFALKSVPGIGNHLFKRLLDRFGTPEEVFSARHSEIVRIDGISPRLASGLLKHKLPGHVKEDMDLALASGCRIITMGDRDYPYSLLQIPDPPPFLYVYGDLEGVKRSIAVVGARNATSYGIVTTKRLSSDLASLGITVVSGMARGIDTAAHIGALSGKGKTIAVLGSGFQHIYPPENRRLFDQIRESGAVITEFPMKTRPEGRNFPIRNRIISGISLGVVVVEAAVRSGSLITARMALEQNREVFAVPGNVHSCKSTGTHSLIKQGAKLVENARDITEELLPQLLLSNEEQEEKQKKKRPGTLTPDEEKVFNALGPYPIHIDDLTRKLGMDAGKLSSILLQLELKGAVNQAPGKLFSAE